MRWTLRGFFEGDDARVHRCDRPGGRLDCVARCRVDSAHSFLQATSAARNLITVFLTVNNPGQVFSRRNPHPVRGRSADTAPGVSPTDRRQPLRMFFAGLKASTGAASRRTGNNLSRAFRRRTNVLRPRHGQAALRSRPRSRGGVGGPAWRVAQAEMREIPMKAGVDAPGRDDRRRRRVARPRPARRKRKPAASRPVVSARSSGMVAGAERPQSSSSSSSA
jgi:hypothetical protein